MLSETYFLAVLQRATTNKIEAYTAMAKAETNLMMSSNEINSSALREAQVQFETAQSEYLKIVKDLASLQSDGQSVN